MSDEELNEEAGMEVDSAPSSDSDDDNEEAKLEKRAEELENEIKSYAYAYDSHVELVGIYKKLMNIEQMRIAYERFKRLFPLTPNLWLDWIKDEMRIATTENEKQSVLKIFENAVKDYLSVDLWLEYVQYSVGCNTADETRKIFEKAISEVGLHVAKGSLIWDAYREFELAHLSCLEVESEQWEPQAKSVADIFKRQLSVTLLDMERTYIEWRVWVEKLSKNDFVDKEQVEWGYKNATKYMDDYQDYENDLLKDEDKLLAYKDYIKYERKPEIIRCLYERAIAEFSLNAEFWLEYGMYFYNLSNYPSCVETCKRAIRNCPWSENLWIFLMRSQELDGDTHDEVTKTMERALLSQFQEGYQYLQLWLAYLEHFKRITDPTDEKSVEKLRAAFLEGSDHIIKNWGNEADPECTLLRLWARIEANFLKNMQEARKIWNDYGILKIHGTNANFWLELIELERNYGDDKHVRKTYQRALNATKDWPQCICQSWMMYERENGTVDSVINCMKICNEVIEKMNKKLKDEIANNDKNEELEKVDTHKKRKHDSEKPYHKAKHGKIIKENKPTENVPKKEPELKDVEMKEEKKFDKIEINDEKQQRSVFISNLDYTVTEDELKEFLGPLQELRLVTDRKGQSKGYAYVVFSTIEEAEKTLKRDRERLNQRPVFISKCKSDKTVRMTHFNYSTETEKHKLFVRGLPLTMSEEEIKGLFEPHGELQSVRLVTYRNGKSKGLAYVEYKNEQDAAKAILGTDNTEIRGFTISVAISAPPKRKEAEQSKTDTEHSHPKSRLQVPLVPRSVQVVQKAAGPSLSNEDFRKLLLKEK